MEQTRTPASDLSLMDAFIVSTICFGLFIATSTQAMLAGYPDAEFSDASNIYGILTELVLAVCALLYLRARRFDLRPLYPRPDWIGALQGAAIYVVAVALALLATGPLVADDGSAPMVAFSFEGVSLTSTVAFAIVNGTFEEVFLLGVLVRGLKGHGVLFAAGLSLLVRLLYHTYQGPVGAVSVLAFGLVLTAFYVRTGRLWPVVFAHILGDIVPVVLSQG
ncbi:type II CAAX endopeptidase family protein [Pseudoxanthomonas sp. PXM02]|uniref:CPBP family intramembrane glutamic endopeptidase n=1 Tax=Pseudoxanthomonas sp. PXM02 TaxID=2769294 RepID=UPI00177CB4C4|nr:type II CAAX endopeptidase family protein [Pseudoxanthomonas sp. PXM02]MBD9480700.1 CPBP family intramembrane metalloprotease [Pseudoxanthomonas sp. PXM02]